MKLSGAYVQSLLIGTKWSHMKLSCTFNTIYHDTVCNAKVATRFLSLSHSQLTFSCLSLLSSHTTVVPASPSLTLPVLARCACCAVCCLCDCRGNGTERSSGLGECCDGRAVLRNAYIRSEQRKCVDRKSTTTGRRIGIERREYDYMGYG